MSNIKSERFSLSQFAVSLGALCAKTDDRAIAIAEFLSVQLEKAGRAWLLGGSDSLNQALAKIENSGKAVVAVKIRKVVRTVSFEGFSAWGTLQAFSVVPREGLIGGNSERAKDKPARAEACTAYGEAIRATTLRVFAKAVPDGGHVDPLAFAGAYNVKSIGIKLASASELEMLAAVQRMGDLTQLINLALELRATANEEPEAVEPATVEPAAIEPATVEPAAVEPAAVEPAAIEPATVEPAAVEPAAVEPAAVETPTETPAIEAKAKAQRVPRELKTGTNG